MKKSKSSFKVVQDRSKNVQKVSFSVSRILYKPKFLS